MQPEMISFIEDNGYQIKSMIGQGAFSKVYKATSSKNINVAIKIIGKNLTQNPWAEIQIHSTLCHPNIVKLITTFEGLSHIFIVMEYIQNGTLVQYNEDEFIDDKLASNIMRGILEGLSYIHDLNIIHRDIKPENILMKNGQPKISDFGLSHQSIGFVRSSSQRCGTLIYMAPEQIEKKQYSRSVDVYSCGIVMFMLLSGGQHPIYTPKQSKTDYLEQLASNKDWVIAPDYNFTSLAKDFFRKVTSLSQFERYTVQQALRHPWITRIEDDPIPMTVLQNIRQFQTKINVSQRLQAMMILMFFKQLKTQQQGQYKLLNLVNCDDKFHLPSENSIQVVDERDIRNTYYSPKRNNFYVKKSSKVRFKLSQPSISLIPQIEENITISSIKKENTSNQSSQMIQIPKRSQKLIPQIDVTLSISPIKKENTSNQSLQIIQIPKRSQKLIPQNDDTLTISPIKKEYTTSQSSQMMQIPKRYSRNSQSYQSSPKIGFNDLVNPLLLLKLDNATLDRSIDQRQNQTVYFQKLMILPPQPQAISYRRDYGKSQSMKLSPLGQTRIRFN